MALLMARPMKRKESKYLQFCKVIPHDVRHRIPVTAIKRSLKTTDDSKAKEKQAKFLSQAERLVINAREGRALLSDKEAKDLAQKWLVQKLDEDEQYREEYGRPDQELWHREQCHKADLESIGGYPDPILEESPMTSL